MNKLINVVLYISITIAVLQNVFVVAVPLTIWFTFRAGAVWLIPLAFLIDGYFGAFYAIPIFSITICVWFSISEVIRPRLLWQETV